MEIQRKVACNVKELRRKRELTLDEAAKLTGVSRSMFAQIEKGEVNPTISMLWKIANGFKVSFSSLVENPAERSEVIRSSDIEPLTERGDGYVNYPIFPFREDRLFETYRIQIEAGGSLEARTHLAGTEEYITVFSGQVEITAGEEVFLLDAGDSVHFMADVPHGYRNAGPERASLSMILYYRAL